MAVRIPDFNETEDFEEYNPHPYLGGYDIALTYGNPLPPTSAICYPMSNHSSRLPLLPAVPLPLAPVVPPTSPEVPERAVFTSNDDDLLELDHTSSYGYGEWSFTSVDWWRNPYGFSPFPMNCIDGMSYDAEDLRYWSQLRRAADYIFGYSQGFGERRAGVDSYGIPVYAYKRHGIDTVSLEIQPGKTEKLEYHNDSEIQLSTNDIWDDGNHRLGNSTHVFLKHHSEEPFDADVDPVLFSHGENRNEVNSFGNLEMAYNTHHYGGATLQLEAFENSFQKLSYHEDSHELYYTDSNWEPPYNLDGEERNTFNDAFHGHEKEDYQQKNSSFDEWGNEDKFHSSEYAYQTHHDGHFIELEPFKPTWMQNPNYYGSYEEISASYKQEDGSYGSM